MFHGFVRYLDFTDNTLSGTLPASLTLCKALRYLTVPRNQLSAFGWSSGKAFAALQYVLV